jgi:hypothetical protein
MLGACVLPGDTSLTLSSLSDYCEATTIYLAAIAKEPRFLGDAFVVTSLPPIPTRPLHSWYS